MPTYRTLPSGHIQAIVRAAGYPTKRKTFPTKTLAKTWAERVQAELHLKVATGNNPDSSPTLPDLIDWYITTAIQLGKLSKTALGNLRRLKEGLAGIHVHELTAEHIVAHVHARREGRHRLPSGHLLPPAGAATMSVELTFLGQVLRLAAAMKRAKVTGDPVGEARTVLKQFRLIAKSNRRERRPTADELQHLHAHFEANAWRRSIPMNAIIDFAIGTGRREGEITRLLWSDLDEGNRTILLRDVKHPRKKLGNHKRFPLLGAMFDLVMAQPRTGPRIFPYNSRSVGTAFSRACKDLHIEDLHFHDLRHEATSRLFEAGYSIEQVAMVTLHENWDDLKRYANLKPESLHRD